jgi:uncharacterized protein YukE
VDKQEIRIDYINLNNDIQRLKRLEKELDKYSICTSSFSKSQGNSKEALDSQLKEVHIVGATLQATIRQLIDELENAAKTFKETDETWAKLFRSLS